jgi:hypothetical protein
VALLGRLSPSALQPAQDEGSATAVREHQATPCRLPTREATHQGRPSTSLAAGMPRPSHWSRPRCISASGVLALATQLPHICLAAAGRSHEVAECLAGSDCGMHAAASAEGLCSMQRLHPHTRQSARTWLQYRPHQTPSKVERCHVGRKALVAQQRHEAKQCSTWDCMSYIIRNTRSAASARPAQSKWRPSMPCGDQAKSTDICRGCTCALRAEMQVAASAGEGTSEQCCEVLGANRATADVMLHDVCRPASRG